METRARYVAVGAFVLILVFVAFTAVLWLAGTEFATQYARYDIYFSGPVTGLSKGARVDYNGIPVGRVFNIEIDQQNVERIRVEIEIEKSVVIKEDAAANVESNILSGVSYILITRGTQEAKVLTAQQGQRYPVIRPRRSTLASISARGPQLLEKADQVLERLQDVLNDQNRQVFADILSNIRTITGDVADHSKDLGAAMTEAGRALAAVDKLFTDVDQSYTGSEGLKEQISTALVDFDRLVKGLGTTNQQVQVILQDVRPGLRNFSSRTLTDVDNLVGETRNLISGLSRITATVERDPSRLLFGDRREGYRPQ